MKWNVLQNFATNDKWELARFNMAGEILNRSEDIGFQGGIDIDSEHANAHIAKECGDKSVPRSNFHKASRLETSYMADLFTKRPQLSWSKIAVGKVGIPIQCLFSFYSSHVGDCGSREAGIEVGISRQVS